MFYFNHYSISALEENLVDVDFFFPKENFGSRQEMMMEVAPGVFPPPHITIIKNTLKGIWITEMYLFTCCK